MKNIGVIVASHGNFSKEAMKTVEMISGYAMENYGTVSVLAGMEYQASLDEIKEMKKRLNTQEGLVILTDIYGGTPSNIATYLAIEDENILVYAGVNLPILMELFLSNCETLEAVKTLVDSKISHSIINVTDILRKDDTDGNQMDTY